MPVAAAPARGWEARKGQAHILAAHGLYITIPHYLSYTLLKSSTFMFLAKNSWYLSYMGKYIETAPLGSLEK